MTGKVKTVKIRKQAPLAQGIERSAPDRKAAGSNPVGCSKEALIFQGFFFMRFAFIPDICPKQLRIEQTERREETIKRTPFAERKFSKWGFVFI